MAQLKLLLIDTKLIMARGFGKNYEPLRSSKDVATGALYHYTKTVIKELEDFRPSHAIAVDDCRVDQLKRTELFPKYKSNRKKGKPLTDDCKKQWRLAERLNTAFGIKTSRLHGYEGDDLIATFAGMAERASGRVKVLSNDKDLEQIRSDHVTVGLSGQHQMAPKLFHADEWPDGRIPKKLVVDFLGLAGDSSDDIPGCPSVGPKTAHRLLERFGSMDAILRFAEVVAERGYEAWCRETCPWLSRGDARRALTGQDSDVWLRVLKEVGGCEGTAMELLGTRNMKAAADTSSKRKVTPRLARCLHENRELIKMSRELATLHTNLPLEGLDHFEHHGHCSFAPDCKEIFGEFELNEAIRYVESKELSEDEAQPCADETQDFREDESTTSPEKEPCESPKVEEEELCYL